MISDICESDSGAVITANIIIGGGAAAIAMPRELKDTAPGNINKRFVGLHRIR